MLLKCFQYPFPPLLTNIQKGCGAFLSQPPFTYALHRVALPPIYLRINRSCLGSSFLVLTGPGCSDSARMCPQPLPRVLRSFS